MNLLNDEPNVYTIDNNSLKDTWIAPFSIKILHNFLDDSQEKYIEILKNNNNNNFELAKQGINGSNIVDEKHKIRYDYTLNNKECSVIDKPLIYKADCNCNLRERWRLLYYDGDSDKKCFRDAHTDWTNHSCHRRMSIIIGLSNPHEYEGGELIFNNNNIKYKLDKNAAVIFDGRLMHEVLPVTKGKRYVLQCFMFDDSGWDLKKNKNGKINFELLGANVNILDIKKTDFKSCPENINNHHKTSIDYTERIINLNNSTNWKIIDKSNMVHSNLSSVDDCFIGDFKDIIDVLDYLEKNNEIKYFSWHKYIHPNKRWLGKAYGLTEDAYIKKNIKEYKLWTKDSNVISGYKLDHVINSNIKKKSEIIINHSNKLLLNISTDGGPGNQIVGIKESIIMSKILNRKLLVFPIIQHYVLNRKIRNNSNNLKYWNFNEIFFYDDDEIETLDIKENNKYNLKNIKNQYFLKRQDIIKPVRNESILNLNIENKIQLNIKQYKKYTDYSELKNISSDEILLLTDLYNNTFISNCSWNGCDTCKLNPEFENVYKEICSKFDFSEKIKNYGNEYIKKTFNNNKFISLHLRYSDYGNDDLKSTTKSYNESDINKLIIDITKKENISSENIFIATSNQNRILNSDLKLYNLFKKDVNYEELESFIEQYICSMSEIFIYSGAVACIDKSNHLHKRSTWSSFVLDYRTFLLNKVSNRNIYLSDIFI